MARAGRFYFAKFVQLIAIGTVAVGFVQGFFYGDIRMELTLLGTGAVVFALGWLLERRGR